MDPSSSHSAGSRDPAPTSSSAPPEANQGTKRKFRDRLTNVGAVLSKGAGVFEFGPWKAALDDIGELKDAIQRVTYSREEGERLVDELDELLNDVCKHLSGDMSPAVKSSIDDFVRGLRSEIEALRNKQRQRSKIGRLGEAMRSDDEVKECCRRVKMLLRRLSASADMSILKTVDDEKTKRLLKTLPDSPSAKYCSTEAENLGRGECTPNTRVELLEQLRAWACDDKAQKVYWLNGMAGTGKTTIAYSLCKYLQTTQKLGASFFCSQRLPECRDVNRIVPGISYRLSLFSVPFRHALASVLQDDEDAHNQPLEEQFDALFVRPLQATMDTFPDNVVIVIDALDECDDQGGVAKVITTLLSYAATLPVKFFVTSRPEPKIVDQMRKKEAEGVRLELRLHELKSTIVRQDIATYLVAKLAPAGLSDTELNILVRRSGVLFIYAATVVRFIEFDDFSDYKERLRLVLDASATLTNESDEALNELYTAILKTALELKGLRGAQKATRGAALRHVVCAREPLPLDVMTGLLQVDDAAEVSAALRPLQSVLSVSESGVIGTLHESFPNYLLNRARSGRFYCDPGQHHAQMAQRCFRLIKVPNPPFNICKLESSYLLDEEVPDLDLRMGEAIPQALLYACRYWAAHLELGDHNHNLLALLYELLSERLLLWIEVMNLKKLIWEGLDMLRNAQIWCKRHASSKDLQLLVQDASGFVSAALSSPASGSTPHIYISTLAFWPKSRPVAKHYLPRFPGLVKVTGTAMESHQLTPATLQLPVKKILGFAHCPNSQHIAFINENGYFSFWNIRAGRCEASFGGAQTRPRSVAFSHDGLHLLLGYDYGAIRIWDTQTRQMVADLARYESTTGSIRSITCSPDGDHIAASSGDGNVYIWNRRTEQIIASLPGYGIVGFAQSVAYSPDGAYIASGLGDGTICIWNVYSSLHMREHELSGHTKGVNSIKFSPNSAHIASSSDDGTIRIWDARTGELIGGPLGSHDNSVTSLQYSPSGLHLASGSHDGYVRIWDLLTGRVTAQLLNPNPDLYSDSLVARWVTYSLDGEQVLACSESGTLYLWNSSVVELAVKPCCDGSVDVERAFDTDLDRVPTNSDDIDRVVRGDDTHAPRTADRSPRGHDCEVKALAYSTDGAYIVSGSNDCTLRIWDVHTGGMAGQPLEGHTGRILSVSFSPDGARIVSGSDDETIRIWDVGTCTMSGAPLIGHTDSIRSVSYSPDGAHIASGSDDETIRVWDAYTGQMVGSPLRGHTSQVHSVSYSPSGVFLVSGSDDKTIRIWNTQNGETVGCPLEGHGSSVWSVAYSPDGLYVVSCSKDTVCVWDAYTSSMVGGPFKFRYNQFHSVSYSSVGANLSLNYLNGAIHISHPRADRDLVQPFTVDSGEDYSTSFVFSPDGTRIAFGYDDGTIRVSNSHVRQVLDAEMRSHGDRPCAVKPCTCSICASHSDWGTWELDEAGWVVNGNSQNLIWIPVKLRNSLQLPYNTALMSRDGALQLEFSSAKLGESWSECYAP
ncbi:hypothetical protein FRC12_007331 [Ceratobasidium sp. 428]|nr:hypothetical protein FRC12_007331 [Ceratobasidium sp. 428]